MSETAIKSCACYHPVQDKMYGAGKRVFNRMKGGEQKRGWRCTVCGNVISIREETTTASKKKK